MSIYFFKNLLICRTLVTPTFRKMSVLSLDGIYAYLSIFTDIRHVLAVLSSISNKIAIVSTRSCVSGVRHSIYDTQHNGPLIQPNVNKPNAIYFCTDHGILPIHMEMHICKELGTVSYGRNAENGNSVYLYSCYTYETKAKWCTHIT